LDYTLLNKKETNFSATCAPFDIKEAIREILEIQEDKAVMKAITVRVVYEGFRNIFFNGRNVINYFVKTDQKRMQ